MSITSNNSIILSIRGFNFPLYDIYISLLLFLLPLVLIIGAGIEVIISISVIVFVSISSIYFWTFVIKDDISLLLELEPLTLVMLPPVIICFDFMCFLLFTLIFVKHFFLVF